MANSSFTRMLRKSLVLLSAWALALPFSVAAETLPETITLSRAIEAAIDANLSLKSSREGIEAAAAAKRVQKTRFYPTFSTSYAYEHRDEALYSGPVMTYARNQATLAATVTQPVFTGYVLENQYALAGLGLSIAEVREQIVRQDITLQVRRVYFSLLKAQKLMEVAQETVTQIQAQKSVAENYYQVGMTPLNDLLQAQVELANAEQALVVARNNLEIARSSFNTVLRRPIDSPVHIENILDDSPFLSDLADCQETAEKNRLEIRVAELQVGVSEKEIELAKGDLYPDVNLQGTVFRLGNDWDVNGGPGISDPEGWTITATASWNFWEWGRTRHGVSEKKRRLLQSQYSRDDLLDRIRLEVKEAYLRTREARENIKAVEKAIEQAKENFRINQERYKEQVATNTDVLIAQTLLSRTMTSYYSALYDFQISKAALHRAMGRVDAE